MSDRSEYTDTGHRGKDARQGFGDDMGTRVGRPDGAAEGEQQAQSAPRDASRGHQPGQAGTNGDAVADGLEGSIMDGPEQERVQRSSRAGAQGGDVNPDPAAGNERRVDDL